MDRPRRRLREAAAVDVRSRGRGRAAWSPDSRRLAFTAKRDDDEVAQVYVLDSPPAARLGASRRRCSLLAGRCGAGRNDDRLPERRLPGGDGPRKQSQAGRRAQGGEVEGPPLESFPIRRWDKWLDEARTHVFVVPVDGDAPARDLLAGTKLAAEAGFGGAGGEASSDDLRPAFAPDGRSLVIVASVDQASSAYASTNTHLYEVSLAGGEPRALTSGTSTYDSPGFSPDGTSRASASPRSGDGSTPRPYRVRGVAVDRRPDRGELRLRPRSGRVRLRARLAHRYSPRKTRVSPVLRCGEAARSRHSSSPVEPSVRSVTARVPHASHRGRVGDCDGALEFVRVDPSARTGTRLTDFGVAAAAASTRTPGRASDPRRAPRRIASFVVRPPGSIRRGSTVLVLIHGGHARRWRDSDHRWLKLPPAREPRVRRSCRIIGLTGYGEAFTLDILGDPLRGPADDREPGRRRGDWPVPFIDPPRQAAAARATADTSRTADRHDHALRCLVSHAGLGQPARAMGDQRLDHHREHHRRPVLGGARGLARPEPGQPRDGSGRPCCSVGGRLPRAVQQRARDARRAPRMHTPSQLLVGPTRTTRS